MRPLTVIDKHGNRVVRHDGRVLDGDKVASVTVPLTLMDNRPPPASPASGPVSVTTLNVARRVLGDAYQPADFARVADATARDLVVARKLGIDPATRSRPFLDAAYRTLADNGSVKPTPAVAGPVLTDAQRAAAKSACDQAVAERAGKGIADASTPVRDAYVERMSNAYKGEERRAQEARDAGLSYEQRMVRRSGGYPSYAGTTA